MTRAEQRMRKAVEAYPVSANAWAPIVVRVARGRVSDSER